jgi:uncharacterized protein (UPF0276 family)
MWSADDFRAAAVPLFERGLVEALEVQVDERWYFGWGNARLPRWANQLRDLYAADDTLYGHGVWYSPLSARWEARQDRWLDLLERECKRRRYRHVSEHFNFMTAGPFTEGTLWGLPKTAAGVRVGRNRMQLLAEAAGVPVGLENHAQALGLAEVITQGPFLDEILAPVSGFALLDLHNVYVQSQNTGMPAEQILATFPLERVRELHLAGGNWFRTSSGERLRTDTHDQRVPDEVLGWIPGVIRRCPNLEVIFLERLGGTLQTPADIEGYRADFLSLREIVEGAHAQAA